MLENVKMLQGAAFPDPDSIGSADPDSESGYQGKKSRKNEKLTLNL